MGERNHLLEDEIFGIVTDFVHKFYRTRKFNRNALRPTKDMIINSNTVIEEILYAIPP